MRAKRKTDVRVIGGCPCGFWSAWNCRYVRAVRVCRYRGPVPEQLDALVAAEAADGTGPHPAHRHDETEAGR